MCDTYKRRIADQHLHTLVKAWWYGLTESERNFWMRRAAAEKAKVATENQQCAHSIREQNKPHDGTRRYVISCR